MEVSHRRKHVQRPCGPGGRELGSVEGLERSGCNVEILGVGSELS